MIYYWKKAAGLMISHRHVILAFVLATYVLTGSAYFIAYKYFGQVSQRILNWPLQKAWPEQQQPPSNPKRAIIPALTDRRIIHRSRGRSNIS